MFILDFFMGFSISNGLEAIMMKTWVWLSMMGLALAQPGATYVPPFIGGNKSNVDSNPALAALLLKKVGINPNSQCPEIPSVGSPGLGVRAYMRNVEAALNDRNLNTRFQFIYYHEAKEHSRLIVTAVSRYYQMNGDGGYFLHKLSINPFSNPTIRTLIMYFDTTLDAIRDILNLQDLDANAYVGCGDVKASWTQLNNVNIQASPFPRAQQQPYGAGVGHGAGHGSAVSGGQDAHTLPHQEIKSLPVDQLRPSQLPQYSSFYYNNPDPTLNPYLNRATKQ